MLHQSTDKLLKWKVIPWKYLQSISMFQTSLRETMVTTYCGLILHCIIFVYSSTCSFICLFVWCCKNHASTTTDKWRFEVSRIKKCLFLPRLIFICVYLLGIATHSNLLKVKIVKIRYINISKFKMQRSTLSIKIIISFNVILQSYCMASTNWYMHILSYATDCIYGTGCVKVCLRVSIKCHNCPTWLFLTYAWGVW